MVCAVKKLLLYSVEACLLFCLMKGKTIFVLVKCACCVRIIFISMNHNRCGVSPYCLLLLIDMKGFSQPKEKVMHDHCLQKWKTQHNYCPRQLECGRFFTYLYYSVPKVHQNPSRLGSNSLCEKTTKEKCMLSITSHYKHQYRGIF